MHETIPSHYSNFLTVFSAVETNKSRYSINYFQLIL